MRSKVLDSKVVTGRRSLTVRGPLEVLTGLKGTGPARFRKGPMVKFLLWLILFLLCWPLALAALVLYPLVWILLLPFRVVGIAVGGALALIWAVVTLPARLLRAL